MPKRGLRVVRRYYFAARFYEAAQVEARKEAEQRDQELLSGQNHVTAFSSDGSKEAETVAR